MSANFTPGPYIADDNEGFGVWNIWKGNAPSGAFPTGQLIATIIGDSAETEPTAHLFAAAPDLYEALNNLTLAAGYMALEDPESEEFEAITSARAALKKARGEA